MKRVLVSLICVCLCIVAWAQNNDFVQYKLDNGLTVYMWEDHDIFPLLGLTAVVWFGATFLLYIMMSIGGSENVFIHYDVVRFMKYRGWEYFDDDDGVGAVNILAPAAVEQMLEEIRQECGCEVIFK